MLNVFDVETTGLFEPQVVQAGLLRLDKDFNILSAKEDLFKPTKTIEWSAMGIHNITNEMLTSKPLWDSNKFFSGVSPSDYLVAHNISFDSKFIKDSNMKMLCTLKLAKRLIKKTECDNNKNMTLFYYLGCYKDPIGAEHIGQSHSALSDATITANILYVMLKQFNLTIEQAYQLTIGDDKSEPNNIDISTCPFKKWAGVPWTEVIQKDRDYVQWLLTSGKIQDGNMVGYIRGLL